MRPGDDFDWLGGHSVNQSGGSGGQFAGLMDGLHPLPRPS